MNNVYEVLLKQSQAIDLQIEELKKEKKEIKAKMDKITKVRDQFRKLVYASIANFFCDHCEMIPNFYLFEEIGITPETVQEVFKRAEIYSAVESPADYYQVTKIFNRYRSTEYNTNVRNDQFVNFCSSITIHFIINGDCYHDVRVRDINEIIDKYADEGTLESIEMDTHYVWNWNVNNAVDPEALREYLQKIEVLLKARKNIETYKHLCDSFVKNLSLSDLRRNNREQFGNLLRGMISDSGKIPAKESFVGGIEFYDFLSRLSLKIDWTAFANWPEKMRTEYDFIFGGLKESFCLNCFQKVVLEANYEKAKYAYNPMLSWIPEPNLMEIVREHGELLFGGDSVFELSFEGEPTLEIIGNGSRALTGRDEEEE